MEDDIWDDIRDDTGMILGTILDEFNKINLQKFQTLSGIEPESLT